NEVEIIKLEIPTVIGKSIDKLTQAVETYLPDVVLCVGQAGGRSDISVERIAINIDDCRIKDNEGNQPIDEPIVVNGPDAYFLTLPIKSIVSNLQAQGIPASVSNSAGTFICNHVAYGMAHLAKTKYPNMKTGFIHIPFIPEQVLNKSNMPSLPLDRIIKALEIVIQTISEVNQDIKETGGKIC
ncbi:MAG: pyroglutamyl-peptidase I, partial [Erysipelotrichaceae bacterium]